MNKVFKVIWSEARNAYVVVSEIAKNHGSKSCSTKKLLTMLIATGIMTCASMAPAMAADPASDDANKGWNLVTNGVVTDLTEIKNNAIVNFEGDKNISVSKDPKDGVKTVKVELNKDIDVNSVQTNALNSKYNLSVGTAADNGIMPFFVNSNGAFYAAGNKFSVDKDGKVTAPEAEINKLTAKEGVVGNVVLNKGVFYKNSALRDGELFIGDADGNYSQITPKSAKLGKVTVAADGKISGVAAGEISDTSTDAINGSQLKETNDRVTANETAIKNNADAISDLKTSVDKVGKQHTTLVNGDNIIVTEGTNEEGGKEFTVALDKNITVDSVKVGDKTYISDKGLNANDQKATNVAAGELSETSKDAVNGSQLYKTNQEVVNNTALTNWAAV